jgi:hypothetical protein
MSSSETDSGALPDASIARIWPTVCGGLTEDLRPADSCSGVAVRTVLLCRHQQSRASVAQRKTLTQKQVDVLCWADQAVSCRSIAGSTTSSTAPLSRSKRNGGLRKLPPPRAQPTRGLNLVLFYAMRLRFLASCPRVKWCSALHGLSGTGSNRAFNKG